MTRTPSDAARDGCGGDGEPDPESEAVEALRIETPQTFGGLTLDDIEALLPEIELEGVGYIEDCDHVAQDAIKSMIGFVRSLSVK